MSARAFLDTNVLVYAHDRSDPRKQDQARSLIAASLRHGTGLISAQVLSEFFVTMTRKIQTPMTVQQARNELVLLAHLEAIDIDADLLLRATHMQADWRIQYWDALVLAAAERGECSIVYSEDFSHGQTYGTLTVCNPFQR